MSKIYTLVRQHRGQTLVEYALLMCIVSITAILALAAIGQITFNHIIAAVV
ncbi:MAG: hypothetical protein AAGU23_03590 [Bacillota bacterium]